MKKLMSKTGWTKEDWIEFRDDAVCVIGCVLTLFLMMFFG